MYTLEFLEIIKKMEAELQFSAFDLEDAYAIGSKLREAGKTAPKPIAVRILFDDLIVYQSFLPGTGERNNQWMNRKLATVNRCHSSSLRATVERDLFGATEPWQSDEDHYAFSGGGFPLVVNGVYRGAVIISGLPHLDDHRYVCQALAEYLGKEPITLPDV